MSVSSTKNILTHSADSQFDNVFSIPDIFKYECYVITYRRNLGSTTIVINYLSCFYGVIGSHRMLLSIKLSCSRPLTYSGPIRMQPFQPIKFRIGVQFFSSSNETDASWEKPFSQPYLERAKTTQLTRNSSVCYD